MADELLYPSPAPHHPQHSAADLDIDSFLALDSPSSASASSPPSRDPTRFHPPPRHRRCLFGPSSRAPDSPASTKPPPPPVLSTINDSKSCKKRGAYNCGKCGQPKRGHVCVGESVAPKGLALQELHVTARRQPHPQLKLGPRFSSDQNRILSISPCSPLPPSEISFPISSSSMTSSCSSNERYKRALHQAAAAASESVEASAVADADASVYSDNSSYDLDVLEAKDQALPLACLVHILSRLSRSPRDLVAASNVCRRWRQSAEYVWAGIRQTSISIEAPTAEEDFLPFILQKCSSLQELTLNVTSELGDSLLKRISNSTRYLTSLEVSLMPAASNLISGEGLTDLLRHCKTLSTVKVEGCDHVAEVELSSSRLATLWLTRCHRLKYMFLNCPELSELCLDFLPGEHVNSSAESMEDSDRLAAIMKNLGCTAKGLTRLHVASLWLQDRVVYGLLSPGLARSLRMLSLTFGSNITDKSVAAIAANCEKLELLDLSGSSITDMAIELICNSFSTSLARLLIALCPNVSQNGLQMVVSKLPLLQVLDCGKVMIDKNTHTWRAEEADGNSTDFHRPSHVESKDRCAELQLQHERLQKLSLWGCTGLEALSLDCPSLVDLNLTGCSKLEPGRLELLCPSLKDVHMGKCGEDLLCEVQCQLELVHFDSKPVRRGQGDGSKRVQALNVLSNFGR